MKFGEIFAFLTPSNDPIQLFFGGLFLILIVATLVGVWRGANSPSWEKKWKGSASADGHSDDMDVEHGSVNEISAAVASTGEKLADIMPGILLILGLLGTFLGLGIALNKASSILIEANAGGGMDNAMANLMGMMEGLGTKFKTSTWGIMAFLLLKAWASVNGYEERRLRWCVGKMKSAFEHSRLTQLQEREHTQQALIQALGRIDQTLVAQGEASQQLLETQCKLTKHLGISTAATHKSVQNLQQALAQELQNLRQSASSERSAVLEATLGNREAITGLQAAVVLELDRTYTGRQEVHGVLNQALAVLGTQGKTLASTRTAITELHGALVPELQAVRANNETSLAAVREAAALLQEQGKVQHQQLRAMEATQDSLGQLAKSISNLDGISNAAEQMAGAALGVGDSAKELQKVVAGFEAGVTDVLGKLKGDLGDTIATMGSSFTANMTEMANTMAEATGGISAAVKELSENMDQTMESLQASNAEAIKNQQRAQGEFITTSGTLNVNVETMTEQFKGLGDKMLTGLSAVSASGRRMESMDKQFQGVTDKTERSAAAIEQLVTELQKLQQASPLQPAMDAVAGRVDMIGSSLQRMDKHLLALKAASDDERQLHAISYLQQPLERIVDQLEQLDARLERTKLDTQEA